MSFTLDAKAPVVAIKQGDKSILAPGKVVAISVVAGPDGHLVTPGLTVENETGGEVLDVGARQTASQTAPNDISISDLELPMRLLPALLAASLLAAPALAADTPHKPKFGSFGVDLVVDG